ncbi:MAG: phosphoribosyltransferase family protein [Planctomycetota bacterium]
MGPYEVGEFGCSACRTSRLPWELVVRLGVYEGELRGWLHELKFGRWRPAGRTLGRWLGERLVEAGIARDAVLVPMPTTTHRVVQRGIDHTRVLARAMSTVCGAEIVPALRRDHRASQRSVPASDRAANVRNAFAVRSLRRFRGRVAGRTVVLVDDIVTTGATVRAAARALMPFGPSRVVVGVVAVADPPGRRTGSSSGSVSNRRDSPEFLVEKPGD